MYCYYSLFLIVLYFPPSDPVVREWFLVKSNFWPIALCMAYLLLIKVIGPAIMRDRKPFELRKTMIAYNMLLVASYGCAVSVVSIMLGILS